MYIIIKRDKAEHLKEKMHHIKSMAMEVLECIEEAAERRHDDYEDDYRDMARSRNMSRLEDDDYRHPAEREVMRHEMARRGRGRY